MLQGDNNNTFLLIKLKFYFNKYLTIFFLSLFYLKKTLINIESDVNFYWFIFFLCFLNAINRYYDTLIFLVNDIFIYMIFFLTF